MKVYIQNSRASHSLPCLFYPLGRVEFKIESGRGGKGRRSGLKIRFLSSECRFDSGRPHQKIRGRSPRSFKNTESSCFQAIFMP